MITLQQFIDKYLGKQVEYHSYGSGAYNQCVDLVNTYINEVLDSNTKDYTEIIGANAKDFITKYDPDDFDYIANTDLGVPQRGDIVVWNGRVGGGAGHVAVFLEGDVKSFKSLDQNWSQTERVTMEDHPYTNVSGWLRPKSFSQSNELTACMTDREKFWRERDEARQQLEKISQKLGVANNAEIILGEIEKLIKYEDAVIQKDKKIEEATVKIEELEVKIKDLTESNETLAEENKKHEDQLKEQKETIQQQSRDILDLGEKLQQLKESAKLPIFTGWKKTIVDIISRL